MMRMRTRGKKKWSMTLCLRMQTKIRRRKQQQQQQQEEVGEWKHPHRCFRDKERKAKGQESRRPSLLLCVRACVRAVGTLDR